MRTLVLIAAIHIFSLNLFQGGMFAEMARWLLLVQHYEFHCREAEQSLAFTEFMALHYGADSHDHDKDLHEDLPMRTHSVVVGMPIFCQLDQPEPEIPFEFLNKPLHGCEEASARCHSLSFDIFHPPRI